MAAWLLPWSRAAIGRRGERLAAAYLRRRGLRITACNWRAGRGEIDLVAWEGATLVFVEVKTLTGAAERERSGLEKLDRRKLAALRHACARYLRAQREPIDAWRLDAVVVLLEPGWLGRPRASEIQWYPAVVDTDRGP